MVKSPRTTFLKIMVLGTEYVLKWFLLNNIFPLALDDWLNPYPGHFQIKKYAAHQPCPADLWAEAKDNLVIRTMPWWLSMKYDDSHVDNFTWAQVRFFSLLKERIDVLAKMANLILPVGFFNK